MKAQFGCHISKKLSPTPLMEMIFHHLYYILPYQIFGLLLLQESRNLQLLLGNEKPHSWHWNWKTLTMKLLSPSWLIFQKSTFVHGTFTMRHFWAITKFWVLSCKIQHAKHGPWPLWVCILWSPWEGYSLHQLKSAYKPYFFKELPSPGSLACDRYHCMWYTS